ncbi:MAG: thiamine phosphate synthase [Proteobacteria bacterium]|nr:thiamine phosphate synthase [Pseudomonadota bacterium]
MRMLQGLYAIADVQHIRAHDFFDRVQTVLLEGVPLIQYRDKVNDHDVRTRIAQRLRQLTRKHQSLLIINDDVELARAVDADGVHLGKEDCGIDEARARLGADRIVGASCYDDYGNAAEAVENGASYIAFGSFFASPTKPSAPRADLDLIIRAKQEMDVPVCAIGGITQANVLPLLDAGADMIAVISSLFAAPSPARSVQEYQALLQPFCAAS